MPTLIQSGAEGDWRPQPHGRILARDSIGDWHAMIQGNGHNKTLHISTDDGDSWTTSETVILDADDHTGGTHVQGGLAVDSNDILHACVTPATDESVVTYHQYTIDPNGDVDMLVEAETLVDTLLGRVVSPGLLITDDDTIYAWHQDEHPDSGERYLPRLRRRDGTDDWTPVTFLAPSDELRNVREFVGDIDSTGALHFAWGDLDAGRTEWARYDPATDTLTGPETVDAANQFDGSLIVNGDDEPVISVRGTLHRRTGTDTWATDTFSNQTFAESTAGAAVVVDGGFYTAVYAADDGVLRSNQAAFGSFDPTAETVIDDGGDISAPAMRWHQTHDAGAPDPPVAEFVYADMAPTDQQIYSEAIDAESPKGPITVGAEIATGAATGVAGVPEQIMWSTTEDWDAAQAEAGVAHPAGEVQLADGAGAGYLIAESKQFTAAIEVGATAPAAGATATTAGVETVETAFVDDFEDGDLAEYTFTAGSAGTSLQVQSTVAHEGSNALQMDGTEASAEALSAPGDGLPNYPEPGSVLSFWFRIEGDDTDDGHVLFGASEPIGGTDDGLADGYAVQIDVVDDELNLYSDDNDDPDFGRIIRLIPTDPFTHGAWYRAEVDWHFTTAGEITLTLYDTDGETALETGSVTSTHNAGPVVGVRSSLDATTVYVDAYTRPEQRDDVAIVSSSQAPAAATGTTSDVIATEPSATTIEDWEGTDPLTNWAGETGKWNVQTDHVIEGTASVQNIDDSGAWKPIGAPAEFVAEPGYTYRMRWMIPDDAVNGLDSDPGMIIAEQDDNFGNDPPNNCYFGRVNANEPDIDWWVVDGGVRSDIHDGVAIDPISTGTVYIFEVDWTTSNEWQVRIIDTTDDSVLGETPLTTDSTHTANGRLGLITGSWHENVSDQFEKEPL